MSTFDWSNPQSYINLFVTLAIALVVLGVGNMLSGVAQRAALRLSRNARLSEALCRFLGQLARYLVLALAVTSALQYAGVDVMGLVALLGAAGVAIGLALQGNLSNFASGVMILIFQPFQIGDVITAGGHNGEVIEIGLFATTLRTLDHHTIIIPNTGITSGSIVNFTKEGFQREAIAASVAYGTDADRVIEVLDAAVRSVPLVRATPAPVVVFSGLGAHALEFVILYNVDNAHRIDSIPLVRKAAYNALRAAGIEIPFPQLVVHQPARA